MNVDRPSLLSLEFHDGDTEPFAFFPCPHCTRETAFPLTLSESPCATCGEIIRAPGEAG
jgi:hypothetical protein